MSYPNWQDLAWRTSLSCQNSDWTCWNWVIDWPTEQCERKSVWTTLWDFPEWCDNTCKFKPTSQPSELLLEFGIEDSIVIWDWQNAYENMWRPYLKNISDYWGRSDIKFDWLCTTHYRWDTLDYPSTHPYTSYDPTWKTQCRPAVATLYPGETLKFEYTPKYIWNKDRIPANNSYWDNIIKTTVFMDNNSNWSIDVNELYHNTYLSSEFKVRVSKPSIVTTGWWTSYVKTNTKIGDVKKIADDNRNNANAWKNTNFVWAWISDSLSSSSKNVDKADVITDDKDLTEDVSWTNNTSYVENVSDTYNWNSNVFIVKNKDFKITSSTNLSNFSAVTYIVENWDLIIEEDVDVSGNIWFVVKWWNIVIENNVEKIKWTYISIPKNSVGWKIKGGIWTTNNILKVSGSFYGDINDLIWTRTYIKENNNWQIDVWTVVSFGSNLFKKPAPFIWSFIWEYMESEKIAK
jgi:hypothetical protein